ncbi:eCIS core domain-containing protein [Hyalangium versicolor]|uniref:eCIS core domain-containing protein n=1 Tax=Hyalangium versicolor TaxID=2861190 RepID=UPI001CCAFCB2|nr:DUF4157 domain-containing protein [Hyalangium versicolor]
MFSSGRKPPASRAQDSSPKAAAQPPVKSPPVDQLSLQLALLNRAGTGAARLQRKPAVSAPGSELEREADDVAEQVMRMAEPAPIGTGPRTLQRAICSEADDEENRTIQPKHESWANPEPALDTEAAISAAERGGMPLPGPLRSHFEPRFGRDFGQVRVHVGGEAAEAARGVQARAYTIGRDIVFGAGQYQPDSEAGRRLLAHELTHVVQQGVADRGASAGPSQVDGSSGVGAIQGHTAAPFIGRENSRETAAVLRTGTVRGSGVQFWPLQVTSTRIGPVSGQGGLLVDTRNRLSAIVGQSMTLRNLATLLLPLWNSAEPFTPPGEAAPVVTGPLTADDLARGLLVYNRYYLRVLSEPAPAMTGWAGGLRFPLPVEIDSAGVATVNKDLIQSLSSTFDAAWGPLLEQPAAAVTAPPAADLQRAVTDFLTATPDTDAQGRSLATRTITNPVEARPFVLEVLNRVAERKFDVALAFMNATVNTQVSLLASQRDGAAVLGAIRTALTTQPAELSARQQENLNRASHMLGLVSGIVAREPPAVGTASSPVGGTPFPDTQLGAFGSAEQTTFKRQVYNAHVAAARARGREFHMGIADEDLERVEGGRLHRDAAPSLTSLLARARADLATAQAAHDTLATGAGRIGVGSAYRGATEELNIWERLFPDYYSATQAERTAAPGGEHGPAAVRIMVTHYTSRKAAPGFGNHTNGIAVDFTTVQGGTALGASTAQNALWRASWFHHWLVEHAADFHFQPLATEAWHWEYRP